MAISDSCIIKLDCRSTPFSLILQLHKTVIVKIATEAAMVKRTSLERDACPIARSLDAIGDWWSMLIIRDALLGTTRFGEFQKRLGLARNILTVRLRTLVDQGILKTAPASDGSAYQEYLLTPKGRGVFPILVALRQWSEEFDERPEEIATILVDKEKGRPVRKLELHAQDGRLLAAGDTALRPRSAKPGKRG
jgi:DNA-binding HxlR family transcriptional regulator